MLIDWSKIYKKYKGLWVALKDDHKTVVGSGQTLKQALIVAKGKGFSNPFVTKVPNEVIPFVG